MVVLMVVVMVVVMVFLIMIIFIILIIGKQILFKRLDDEAAQFYTACVMEGLQFLESQNILYR